MTNALHINKYTLFHSFIYLFIEVHVIERERERYLDFTLTPNLHNIEIRIIINQYCN